MKVARIAALSCLVALVAAAHVALWTSADWDAADKLRLTILNALGWAVVILPALAVGRWAAMHRGVKTTRDCTGATQSRNGS